jgi:hypothetical protein
MLRETAETTTVKSMHGTCQCYLTLNDATRPWLHRIAQNLFLKSRNTFVFRVLVVKYTLHWDGTPSI